MSQDAIANRIRSLNTEIVSIKKEFAWELKFDSDIQSELRQKQAEQNMLINQYRIQFAA